MSETWANNGHLPTLDKAHDVRHIGPCNGCTDMGDKRRMLFGQWHGRCFIAKSSLDSFLDLPSAETDKVSLGDIGTLAMKALIDRRTPPALRRPLKLKPTHLLILRSCKASGGRFSAQSGNWWQAAQTLIQRGLITELKHPHNGTSWCITDAGRDAIAK